MKKCNRCNEIKPHASWNPYYCKDCRNKRCREYNKLPHYKLKRKQYNKKAQLNGNHKIWNQKYRDNLDDMKKEALYEKRRAHNKQDTENLGDECIKRLLCKRNSLRFADISDKMIELKRLEMQLKRELGMVRGAKK